MTSDDHKPTGSAADLFRAPVREYALLGLLAASFAWSMVSPASARTFLALAAGLGAVPTLVDACKRLRQGKLGIDAFNVFAVVVSFATGELRSAAFIALMLSSARLLDWRTESRTHDAIEELLKLKPLSASVERGDALVEVAVDEVREGDIVVVKTGGRVPVDGTVVAGGAHVNEAPVTGESLPVEKSRGDEVMSATLVESGTLKMRAVRVGKDSTVERMAALMRSAAEHKSRAEAVADRFAGWFLPFVALLGFGTWFVTGDVRKMAAIFLVACADDMAVAIPLAMTAALGIAARRGVVVKGGEWLEAIARMRTLVVDKTGTLTYGKLGIRDVHPEPWIGRKELLMLLASAEKFSEHPIGKAIFRAVAEEFGPVTDPESFEAKAGSGVVARVAGRTVVAGNERVADVLGLALTADAKAKLEAEKEEHGQTSFWAFVDGRFAGLVTVADVPRPEAAAAVRRLAAMGVRTVMFTGDNVRTAADVSAALGIAEHRAAMDPASKLSGIEAFARSGAVGMVGDGINDAPALARADVGIAMGGGGTAVAVEAADVVILSDDLSRIPETVELGRKTLSVIRGDAVIWVATNLLGFVLVLTGVFGPAFAAFYNFATDFLPILNSSLLFRAYRDGDGRDGSKRL
ncbi:MAG TPA: cation-translocating P-type ATPase [Candidatus Binatia bacterium]|nr:cation-translocating P-type ATPase [Candidatus Binatia bacterium]